MPYSIEKKLASLAANVDELTLNRSLMGVEKESLRVNAQGSLAQTPHPEALGSALTHPQITTDYSEGLLELITPPLESVSEVMGFLSDLQTFVYQNLDDEFLWATSMPCVVAGEAGIPLARYGSSNLGKMKTAYRRGLGHRYGRVMQVIAGVHFNFSYAQSFWDSLQSLEQDHSASDVYRSQRYFDLLRNLQRVGWIIPFLFGASPAVCKSFLNGRTTTLASFDETTYYDPWATSLRMGDIGYQNNLEAETGVKASYDSLDAYVNSLRQAITTPCPRYQKIGIERDGEFQQLNANILQIENEYYSTVRPKQPPRGMEMPTVSLARRGVQYIELRSLDVNAFHPLGIDEDQLRFVEMLMLYCLLLPSDNISAAERKTIDQNEMIVAHMGRKPELRLQREGQQVALAHWAGEIMDQMHGIAEIYDQTHGGNQYQTALNHMLARVRQPELTPSAVMLDMMRDQGVGFYHWAHEMSMQHQKTFLQSRLSEQKEQSLRQMAMNSLQQQREIEMNDKLPFAEFLQSYFSQTI